MLIEKYADGFFCHPDQQNAVHSDHAWDHYRIGSVISIVSIGDTMRAMFADLYKNVGLTQAYVSIGYWVDDTRQGDYFTLDEMEQVKEAFSDEIAYIDSSASASAKAVYKRTSIDFSYEGIDWNYQDVQPVNMVYGRYLNEGDILGRKKNVVMDTDSALKLFGVEDAVGRTFRTTFYGTTDDFTVVGVYRKEINAFQAMMMGQSKNGSAFIPYTLLTWPNDYFYSLHVYAREGVNLDDFFGQLQAYCAKLHSRNPNDMYVQDSRTGNEYGGFHNGRPVGSSRRNCGNIPGGGRQSVL